MQSAYTKYVSGGIDTFPPHNIDPRQKGYEWIIANARAAYRDNNGLLPVSHPRKGKNKIAEIKMYTMAKQPVDKYKKTFSPGSPTDVSWRAVDWTPPGFMCKFRNIGITKCLQKKYDTQFFLVDPLSVSEEDAYFNQMRIKIMAREAAEAAGSELALSPMLAPQPGEPQDMDELYMQKDYGYKHKMAIEAEDANNLINQQNDNDEIRKQVVTSLYDIGIGARTQYLDENGMVKQRAIDMEYFGCSYFEKPNGSDMTYWYELVPTFIADLAPYYTKEQMDEICKIACSKNGNPQSYTPYSGVFNTEWNRFKVLVMRIKFLSWNETIYKEQKDTRGNQEFGKSDYANKRFTVNKKGELEGYDNDYNPEMIEEECKGEQTPKYINSSVKVVYKACWIVDTDYMHDWGLQENQNRKLSSWWDTDLDIQLYTWNFYKMQFTGISELLIPFEDRACNLWFNIQNISNKLIPYLISINMTSVEASFQYGKAGQSSKPAEVADFIFSNFVVPYRTNDLQSRNPNFKPMSIEATGQLGALSQLHEELEYTLLRMQQVAGLNEVTDASTVNERNLNSTNAAMVESTNNALYLLSQADKYIIKKTADATIQKVQIAVKLGKVEGYAKALGESTVKFFKINPDISLRELGVYVDEAPTDLQREALWADINMKESQGLLTPADKGFVMSIRNLQSAYSVLDHRINKRKQEAQQFELQKIQEGAAANGQMAMMQEQMKQQTIKLQLDADLVRINAQMQWQYEIEQMKKQHDLQGEIAQVEGRNVGHEIQGQAKIIASRISAEATLEKSKMDAEKKKAEPAKK
jgi:hypothetical protein